MPKILVTRKLPASVIAKLEAIGDVDLYTGDNAIPVDELRSKIGGAHALVAMLTEQVDKTLVDRADQLRIVANVAVG